MNECKNCGQLKKDHYYKEKYCSNVYNYEMGSKQFIPFETICGPIPKNKGCGKDIIINGDWEEGFGIVNTIKTPATSIRFNCGINGNLYPSCSYPKGHKPNSPSRLQLDKDLEDVPHRYTDGNMGKNNDSGSDIHQEPDRCKPLSDKFVRYYWNEDSIKDVAEFIRRLKEKVKQMQEERERDYNYEDSVVSSYEVMEEFNKLAGEFK